MIVIEWLALIVSVGLSVWMLYDAYKVSTEYDEEFLTTSVEGVDELLTVDAAIHPSTTRAGGAR